jgi:hypothetical protein
MAPWCRMPAQFSITILFQLYRFRTSDAVLSQFEDDAKLASACRPSRHEPG